MICAKTAEPIEMHFGMLCRMDLRNALHGVQMPAWEGALLGCLAN